MVGGSGFEPLTSSLSTRRAPAAPTAHTLLYYSIRLRGCQIEEITSCKGGLSQSQRTGKRNSFSAPLWHKPTANRFLSRRRTPSRYHASLRTIAQPSCKRLSSALRQTGGIHCICLAEAETLPQLSRSQQRFPKACFLKRRATFFCFRSGVVPRARSGRSSPLGGVQRENIILLFPHLYSQKRRI